MSRREALKLCNCDEILVNRTGTVAVVISVMEQGKDILIEAVDPILGYVTLTPNEVS